jgi:hypothetical protein
MYALLCSIMLRAGCLLWVCEWTRQEELRCTPHKYVTHILYYIFFISYFIFYILCFIYRMQSTFMLLIYCIQFLFLFLNNYIATVFHISYDRNHSTFHSNPHPNAPSLLPNYICYERKKLFCFFKIFFHFFCENWKKMMKTR